MGSVAIPSGGFIGKLPKSYYIDYINVYSHQNGTVSKSCNEGDLIIVRYVGYSSNLTGLQHIADSGDGLVNFYKTTGTTYGFKNSGSISVWTHISSKYINLFESLNTYEICRNQQSHMQRTVNIGDLYAFTQAPYKPTNGHMCSEIVNGCGVFKFNATSTDLHPTTGSQMGGVLLKFKQ